jgi:hypothetical protein
MQFRAGQPNELGIASLVNRRLLSVKTPTRLRGLSVSPQRNL